MRGEADGSAESHDMSFEVSSTARVMTELMIKCSKKIIFVLDIQTHFSRNRGVLFNQNPPIGTRSKGCVFRLVSLDSLV